MTVKFFPPFLDFSEALMASLASRSHEWIYWEIVEKTSVDMIRLVSAKASGSAATGQGNLTALSPFILETHIEVSVQNKQGAQSLYETPLNAALSPSLFLDQIFDVIQNLSGTTTIETQIFKSLDRGNLNFSKTPIPESDLYTQMETTGTSIALWVRGKNSRGDYLESVAASNS